MLPARTVGIIRADGRPGRGRDGLRGHSSRVIIRPCRRLAEGVCHRDEPAVRVVAVGGHADRRGHGGHMSVPGIRVGYGVGVGADDGGDARQPLKYY